VRVLNDQRVTINQNTFPIFFEILQEGDSCFFVTFAAFLNFFCYLFCCLFLCILGHTILHWIFVLLLLASKHISCAKMSESQFRLSATRLFSASTHLRFLMTPTQQVRQLSPFSSYFQLRFFIQGHLLCLDLANSHR
jgi:hypothetical protein